YQFAIGGLPQQKVREPLLAARADDHVRIRQIRCIEMTSQYLGGGFLWVERAARRILSKAPRCPRDLLACALGEGDDEAEAGIAARQVFRLLEQPPDVRIEVDAVADDADANIVVVQLGKIVPDESPQ